MNNRYERLRDILRFILSNLNYLGDDLFDFIQTCDYWQNKIIYNKFEQNFKKSLHS